MDNQTNRVVIARFGRPHGIKGFVTVHSFTDPRDNILKYSDWHAFLNNQWEPIRLLSVETYIKAIIVQVEGFSERETAAQLTNVEIAVREEQLAALKPGEYYWYELVGMNVVNQQGIPFGKVVEVMPTGSNDVLVVAGEKRHLIPWLPGQFVLDINKDQQMIQVDWDVDF